MILQELLRNIVTYKEFIKPYIDVWKEALVLRYDSINAQAISRNKAAAASISDAIASSSLTGTRTIPTPILFSLEQNLEEQLIVGKTLATVSNNALTMLMNNGICEDAVITGRTISFDNAICLSEAKRKEEAETVLTTGFTIEKPYLNHEGRELLGGFSLSHERHPLLYMTERR